MTRDDIRAEFDRFIEFPEGSPRTMVTVTSTLLFAEHIARMAASAEREACAKVAEQTACDTHLPTGVKIYGTRAAAAIRTRSQP
jgi:hypothetical protein